MPSYRNKASFGQKFTKIIFIKYSTNFYNLNKKHAQTIILAIYNHDSSLLYFNRIILLISMKCFIHAHAKKSNYSSFPIPDLSVKCNFEILHRLTFSNFLLENSQRFLSHLHLYRNYICIGVILKLLHYLTYN